MKARAEAWQTANYAGPEAEARTSSARSVVDYNERRGQEIDAAISGSATPQGNLSAIGTLLSKSGFSQSRYEQALS